MMAYFPPSELIINDDGSIFHLHMKPHQLADNVILVGDPGRVQMAAACLDEVVHHGSSREFAFVTGMRRGVPFTVLSTGIGTDNIDIVLTELDALANIDFQSRSPRPEHRSLRLLRIGTTGALQPHIPVGTLVYTHIALGFDGLLNWYGNREAVNLPDFEAAFRAHTAWPENLPAPYFVPACEEMEELFRDLAPVHGITISAPGFYGPQCRSIRIPLARPDLMERLMSFSYKGQCITNLEMEGSALSGLARHLGHRYGILCQVVAQRGVQTVNPDYKALMQDTLERVFTRLAEAYPHGQ